MTLIWGVFYTTCRQMIPGIIHRVGSKYTLKIRLLPEVTPKRGVFEAYQKRAVSRSQITPGIRHHLEYYDSDLA